jgi:hypothetical protein
LFLYAGSRKWSCEELVGEQSPDVTAHREILELEWSFLIHHFPLGSLSVLTTTSFSKLVKCGIIFTRLQLCLPVPTQARSAQCSAPPPAARVNYSLHLLGYQFCPVVVQIAHQLGWTLRLPPEQRLCCAHLVGLQIHLGGIWSAPGPHR